MLVLAGAAATASASALAATAARDGCGCGCALLMRRRCAAADSPQTLCKAQGVRGLRAKSSRHAWPKVAFQQYGRAAAFCAEPCPK